jgi:hypothetical protein
MLTDVTCVLVFDQGPVQDKNNRAKRCDESIRMVDDLYSQQLQEAVRKAVLDLLAHEHVGLAGFSFPLNDRLSVAVKQTHLLMDSDRFEAM